MIPNIFKHIGPFNYCCTISLSTTNCSKKNVTAIFNISGLTANPLAINTQASSIKSCFVSGSSVVSRLFDKEGFPVFDAFYRLYEEIESGSLENVCTSKDWHDIACLLAYMGNLQWRSLGSFGLPELYTFENDLGPDDANHDQDGVFVLWDPREDYAGQHVDGLQLMDVAPTILDLMGIPCPSDMQGTIVRR